MTRHRSAITVFLLTLAVRARRNKVATGSEGMIGETGTAVTELAPEGKIFVHGEYWDAVSPRPVAIGARVRLTASGHSQIDEVRSGGSYLSQNDLRLHFGLGSSKEADRIEVNWPSGVSQTLDHVKADHVWTIREPYAR